MSKSGYKVLAIMMAILFACYAALLLGVIVEG